MLWLNQLLVVDDKFELQTQTFRCTAAHGHAVQEDLKVVHHRAVLGLNVEVQPNGGLALVDLQTGLGDRIVYPVMDVKGVGI